MKLFRIYVLACVLVSTFHQLEFPMQEAFCKIDYISILILLTYKVSHPLRIDNIN